MRPVIRGDWPTDQNGNCIEYTVFQNAKGELIDRMGQYCSYCERYCPSDLAVEHILPKQPKGQTSLIMSRLADWRNFLLACRNCNSIKGNKDIKLDDYLWPDRDNIYEVLSYSKDGLVTPKENLPNSMKELVKRTIGLTGLDVTPANDPQRKDLRWKHRREAWGIAEQSRCNLQKQNNEDMKDQIIIIAVATGYWSIWMTVFKDDPDMRKQLIESFPGTCVKCFDENNGYKPKPRLGGLV